MHLPTDPALASTPAPAPGRMRRLASRLAAAKRRAAVVTSVALLAAGGSACGTAPASDAAPVVVAEAPAVIAPGQDVMKLPPAVPIRPVSDVRAEAPGDPEVGTPLEGGRASYYGRELAGNRTASGERFDPTDLTAAHRTLAFGTRVRVTHAQTGESIVVRINDRGPFHRSRIIDLSRAAADSIGLTRSGTAEVALEQLPGGVRG